MQRQQEQDLGSYVWRGQKKIELSKEDDRFTVMVSKPEELERIANVSGVHEIEPLAPNVYKVKTTSTERDHTMAMIRSSYVNTVVHHAYRPQGTEGTIYYLTDEIAVQFKTGTSPEKVEQLFHKYRLNLVRTYDDEPLTCLVATTVDSMENPIKVSNRLAEEQEVEYAEPNMINRFQHMYIPTDDLFHQQWHLQSLNNKPYLVKEASVSATEAWDITKGERRIVVAVIDDGFDLTHPDFQGPGKIVSPIDYADEDLEPLPVGRDYHGTPCAGVAIAEENGQGVVGIAPGCSFMPVRVDLSQLDDHKMKTIFEHVARVADVISCSWGPPPVYAPMSSLVKDTLTRIATLGGPRGKGCVICFAAANFNAPVNDPNNSVFRWRDYSGRMRETVGPIENGNAVHPNVIAIAASTSQNRHAEYSNWGQEISVCAPSNNFNPIDPRKYAPGLGIWTTDNGLGGFDPGSRYTDRFGGTSSATPLVAGVAALMLSANPNLSASDVKIILQQTADKIQDNLPDHNGNNRGDYDQKGHSEWFGFGKVNAAKALKEAKRRVGGIREPQLV
ncbi:S8 family serine peptidase [Paenibacillus terreus]|uniref:S8 family serine peptidase n=1 Tax=Paenibacillus terreus TaxID=1387834 RepID=A0ABV5B2X2_9BACL